GITHVCLGPQLPITAGQPPSHHPSSKDIRERSRPMHRVVVDPADADSSPGWYFQIMHAMKIHA
ncbi:MAG: hypothetical protein AAF191_07515, partial [Verrucomicrobiota bacterium]